MATRIQTRRLSGCSSVLRRVRPKRIAQTLMDQQRVVEQNVSEYSRPYQVDAFLRKAECRDQKHGNRGKLHTAIHLYIRVIRSEIPEVVEFQFEYLIKRVYGYEADIKPAQH